MKSGRSEPQAPARRSLNSRADARYAQCDKIVCPESSIRDDSVRTMIHIALSAPFAICFSRIAKRFTARCTRHTDL